MTPVRFESAVPRSRVKHSNTEPSGGQIVKSQKISLFIMHFGLISSSNGNHLSRPNRT